MGITLHDILEVWISPGDSIPNHWNALRLAPVFGMQDAMTIKNGFGSLPWCTTNNVVTLAFGSTDLLLGGATEEETRAMRSSALMLSFMILGTVSGAAFNYCTRGLGAWFLM